MNKKRPKHLALHLIKLPLAGYVSILHRVSGALLFLALPFLLWALQGSLRSIETYSRLVELLQQPFIKMVWLVLLWAFLHHFCAGIRYLTIDLRLGSGLAAARITSKWVMGVSLLLTVLIGAKLW